MSDRQSAKRQPDARLARIKSREGMTDGVTCDTREQAVAVAKGGQESSQAMLAKYQQLATTIDDKGHPSCANSRKSSLIVNEREDLGLAHSANGDLTRIWVVHGGASRGEF